MTAVAILLIGLLAGLAADLPAVIPMSLLLTVAGLAAVNVLASALQAITKGPLILEPLFAFAIALSKMSFLGLGPFFWSLVLGMLVTLLLERKELGALRATLSERTRIERGSLEPAGPLPSPTLADTQGR